MTLAAGSRLGPYEILAPIGAGRILTYGFGRAGTSDLYLVDGLR